MTRARAGLGIVVCTYDRCDALARCLASLIRLEPPPDGTALELIVVDNNSSDGTRALVESWRQRSPHPVRYVFERRQGLAYARNAGVRTSTAPLIACTDDDCLVAPDWSSILIEELGSVDVVGGRVELHDVRDAALGTRTAADGIRVNSIDDVFSRMIGCNLAFRRSVFDTVGGYDVRFGRPGGTTGDDVDFVYRAIRQGAVVAYSPRPVVFHAHGRRTPEAIRATRRIYARGRGAFYAKHLSAADWTLLRHVYWELRPRRHHLATDAADHRRFVRDVLGGAAYFLRRRFAASDSR